MTAFVNDTFTGSAGTALTAHTGETGATWAASSLGGNIVLSDANRARNNQSGTSYLYASGVPATADYDVDADFVCLSVLGSQVNGIGGRMSATADTLYYATYSTFGVHRWELHSRLAGSVVILGTYDQVLSPGTTYHLKLMMRGTAISLLVDGVVRISGTDSAISAAGHAGLLLYDPATNTTGFHIDNFSASDPSPALAAGSISITTAATDTTAGLTVTEATGGTGPYTRQWYRSTTSGFTPGAGNILAGQTSLMLSQTGLSPSTTYYYKVVQTDSAAATVTTSQQAVTTLAAATKQVVFDGNSLTDPAYSSYAATCVTYLDSLWHPVNVAVAGQFTSQMNADAATEIDTLFNAATYPVGQVVVPWEIRNQAIYSGNSIAACLADYVTYCQARRAAGWRVVAVTCLPGSDFNETTRATINAYIRAHWRLWADALADVAADSRIGQTGQYSDATYYQGDGVHLTTAGYTIVAQYVAPAIQNAITGGTAGTFALPGLMSGGGM